MASSFADLFPQQFIKLQKAYEERHRAYHTWDHIETLLADFRRLKDMFHAPEPVEVALYWHDAIYQPTSATNEADSAAWMMQEMAADLKQDVLTAAESIILSTAKHMVPDGCTGEMKEDCALFLDMDLAILGAGPAVFDEYDAAIRHEFGMFPDEVYFPGRKAVLERFLQRERIYLTDAFHVTHDAPARENLARAVERLSGLV
jgi:predicted metal-dependent HD superfamily phosphohydrolase